MPPKRKRTYSKDDSAMPKRHKRTMFKAKRKADDDITVFTKTTATLSSQVGKQVFPDRLYTTLTTASITTVAGASLGTALSWKAGGLHAVGPQINWAAGFAGNYPSQLTYLLSSLAAAGSTSPYGSYRIHASKIQCSYTPGVTNTVAVNMCVVPSNDISLAGVGITSFNEMPYSTVKVVTPTSTSGEATKIVSFMTARKIYGYKYKASLENTAFTGSQPSDPSNNWYWHLQVQSQDGATNMAAGGQVEAIITHYVEFFNRNPTSSAPPI